MQHLPNAALIAALYCGLTTLSTASPISRDALLVTPVSLTQTQGDSLSPNYTASNLIDNSGFHRPPRSDASDYPGIRHLMGIKSGTWATATAKFPNYFDGTTPSPQFAFTLGGTFDLSAMVIWGYAGVANEATDFTLEFSVNGGASYGRPVHVKTDRMIGVNQETLRFRGLHRADTVRVTMTNNARGRGFSTKGGDRVGLAEVKFLGEPYRKPMTLRDASTFPIMNENVDGEGAYYSSEDDPEAWILTATDDWMGRLPNHVTLGSISIPGTHDSGAIHGMYKAQAQTWTVREQLDAGVRFIDVRSRLTGEAEDAVLWVYHGPRDMEQSVESVVTQVRSFLADNPTETVIFDFRMSERPTAGDYWTKDFEDDTPDVDADDYQRYWDFAEREFIRVFDTMNPGLFLKKADAVLPDLTLQEVRGRAVLLMSHSGVEFDCGQLPRIEGDDTQGRYHVQNKYDLRSVKAALGLEMGSGQASRADKEKLVKQFLDDASETSAMTMNKLAAQANRRLAWGPARAARKYNEVAFHHIGLHPGKHVGLVVMDFPGESLIYRIIKTNFLHDSSGAAPIAASAPAPGSVAPGSTPPAPRPSMYRVTVTKVTCNDTSERGEDELYLQVNNARRYPETTYVKINEDEGSKSHWKPNWSHDFAAGQSALLELVEDDGEDGDDLLGQISFSSATPTGSRKVEMNGDGGEYILYYRFEKL